MIVGVLCGCMLQAAAWAQVPVQAPTLASPAAPEVTLQVSVYQKDAVALASPAGTGRANSIGTTAPQVAVGSEAEFTPFDAQQIFATAPGNHLWLRLRVSSSQALSANAYLLELPKPFIDKVVLHTGALDGTWSSQTSGDWTAHRNWPVHSLVPQFRLPAQMAGSQDLFLEVHNRTPLRFDVSLLPVPQAAIAAQNNFLFIGLALGLMLLMAATSIVLATTYRQIVYMWYGLYVTVNILLSMSFAGLGAYALWPDSPAWAELSNSVLYMLSTIVQVQFCRVMFVRPATPLWLRRAAVAAILLGLLAIPLHLYLLQAYGGRVTFTLQIFILVSVSFGLTVHKFRLNSWVSWLCVLACAPLMVIGGLSLLEHTGLLALTWLPFNAPIYAFAFEMPLLFAALYLNAKDAHALQVRKSTLASTDPASGFIHSSMHMDTLTKMWNNAKAAGQDLVVAYVEVSHQLSYVARHGTPNRERSIERAVRLLRTVAHERDTVAHVDTNLFAILMPSMSLGDDVTDRLARLVALAAMTDQDAASDAPIRFHIAAGSVRSFNGSAKKLHAALQHKLEQTDWGLRAIRYVRRRPAGKQASGTSRPDETLSEFWGRAVDEEKNLSTVPASLAPSDKVDLSGQRSA